ncbi:DedA family protein [Mesorhizobium sp. BAC0120]|uniref:DedA family protein n=1 Tax=Mesorhizobium sp. BAC0120 TaxID=3090670 RepID=UPI00298CEC49|nr:DedA family protein [Mesorhizobium sp. BAC0120]MDW6025520.1 DedA family protein [Mesorhizobium sp. BAC0120]
MIDVLSFGAGLGLAGVLLLTFTEKLLPVPPSHAILLYLGMTVAKDGLQLALLHAVSVLGSTAGSLLWFGVGKALGPDRAGSFVDRFGRYILLRPKTYRRLAESYRRRCFRISLLAQLVPTVRNYVGIAAGSLNLSVLSFGLATLVGSALWNMGFLVSGYLLRGDRQDMAATGLRLILIVIAFEVTVFLLWRMKAALFGFRSGPSRPPG